MTVESIMTGKVLKVSVDDSLATIRDILQNVDFHHLLVVQGRKLVGILSDRDLLRALGACLNAPPGGPGGRSALEQGVHLFMTRDPVTVEKGASIETAAKLMLRHRISCLPVVSPEGGIDGIVTMRDVLKVCMAKDGG